MPERVKLSRKKGFKLRRIAVKVDRSTKWGNPFRVGDKMPFSLGRKFETPEQVVVEFRRLMQARPDLQAKAKKELRGKDLACWCSPSTPCHADVLLEIANAD